MRPVQIESPQHERVVACAKLQQRKFRKQMRQCLVEGPHAIEEALKAGLLPEVVFLDERYEATFPWSFGLPPDSLILAGERVLKKLSTTETPSPCVAVFPLPQAHTVENTSCVLVLDGLQDPGNLGSLIRSAVAFDVSAVVLTQNSVDPYSPKVIRASAGLVFHCPVISVESGLADFFQGVSGTVLLTSSHVMDTGDTTQPTVAYDALPPLEAPLYLVLGNEGSGLIWEAPEHSSLKPLWITIPMNSRVESLNVAMCGSILLAHFHSRSKQCNTKIKYGGA